jgi:hypothetical protein
MGGNALTFPRDHAADYQNRLDIVGGGTRWGVLVVAVRGKGSLDMAMIPCSASAAQEAVQRSASSRAREKQHDAASAKQRVMERACTP